MKYKVLLKKYIEHVSSMEGTDFMPDLPEDREHHPDDFTSDEVRALWKMSTSKYYREAKE